MKRMHRRKRGGKESSISNNSAGFGPNPGYTKSVDDVRNTSKSKEQMKKDWGSKRTTMKNKLAK